VVELTNLQRQILYSEDQVGMPKPEAARQRLEAVNSSVRIEPVVADLTPTNAERLLGADESSDRSPTVILDGTDNFATRLLVNDVAVKHAIAWVYAGAIGTRAMIRPIVPGRGDACLRCMLDEPPPPGSTETCDTAGVLGPAAAVAASLQTAEAIKLMLGAREAAAGDLVEMDLWSGSRRAIDAAGARRDDCACCAHGRFDYLDAGSGRRSAVLCGADTVQVSPGSSEAARAIDLESLARRLDRHGAFVTSPYLMRGTLAGARPTTDHGDPASAPERIELTVFRDGRAIIRGAGGLAAAQSIYDRYVGN